MIRNLAILFTTLTLSGIALGHDGPDPIAHWHFNKRNIDGKNLKSRLGPDGLFTIAPRIVGNGSSESAYFNARGTECVLATDHNSATKYLPLESLTVSAWVAIDEPIDWGAIIGVLQDNGGEEKGWILGYDKSNFYFGLSTHGANDGDGKMTYLKGSSNYERGKVYHVTAVYDGQTTQLYVNGKLDGTSTEQSGKILYPEKAPFTIGSYHDQNEFHPMKGRIREIMLFDLAAKPKWVKEEFEHHAELATKPAEVFSSAKHFVVKPYLQYGTQYEMTVMWRGATASAGKVHWGETAICENEVPTSRNSEIQQVTIKNLSPETQYFYWVESLDENDNPIESELSTFQTACKTETPFAFAVISDTQHNPAVSGPIAEFAWARRPNFLLHPGDLVNQGKINDEWIDEFFASMHPLISRVPMYPVLGNHEQNAKNYFDYMALPDPEYYYKFSYGNTDFFMIDSNRKVHPGSEQFLWLEKSLSESKATWKIVCHHHPPFSSDENDYGDLWKTNKSSRGDLRVRKLVPLYDKYGVDLVWNGHIHSYERTWPLKQERAVNQSGTVYMITGGGGGHLETPGPFRPYFQNTVRRGHHYAMVAINGTTLEMKAFDLNDQLFDSLTIEKIERGTTKLQPSK